MMVLTRAKMRLTTLSCPPSVEVAMSRPSGIISCARQTTVRYNTQDSDNITFDAGGMVSNDGWSCIEHFHTTANMVAIINEAADIVLRHTAIHNESNRETSIHEGNRDVVTKHSCTGVLTHSMKKQKMP